MSITKFVVVGACLLPLAITTQNAVAQTEDGGRARVRFFNPFGSFASSRFAVGRFGLPQLRSASMADAVSVDAPKAPVQVEASSPTPVSVPVPGVTSSLSAPRAGYRPPPRSPFRPWP